MATVKAFGLAMLLLTLTLSLSYGQEIVKEPVTDIVIVDTDSGTI